MRNSPRYPFRTQYVSYNLGVIMAEMVDEDDTNCAEERYALFMNIASSLEGPAKVSEAAWNNYESGRQHCSLEGKESSWMGCAIYTTMAQLQPMGRVPDFECSLSDLLKAADMSVLEFFDKMIRWKEVVGCPRRVVEHVNRMQSSISISAVVFKRFLPIFRTLFIQPNELDKEEPECVNLCRGIWIAFLLLRKDYAISGGEDLIALFHLLLCLVEHFVRDITTNPSTGIQVALFDINIDILEMLCRQFSGVVLDGKHLRKHWFNEKASSILHLKSPMNYNTHSQDYLELWEGEYQRLLMKKCELDETIFLPTNTEQLLNPLFELNMMESLRISLGPSHEAFDAPFMARLSVQNCLNRLSEKGPSLGQTLNVNSEQCAPIRVMSVSEKKLDKLSLLMPAEWTFIGSDLEQTLTDMRDSPLPMIKHTMNNLVAILEKGDEQALMDEEKDGVQDIGLMAVQDDLAHFTCNLFYRLIDCICAVERERTKDTDFIHMFRKEELLTSLFAISLQIILDAYSSERVFPWCISILKLPAISFYKIIEIVVKAETGISRETMKNLNDIEEMILDELAWSLDSPLWTLLSRRADLVPSSESIWNNDSERRALSANYSPVKKRRMDDGRAVRAMPNYTPSTLFFRKVYLLAAARLTDLCERTKMEERARLFVWTTFEHTLRTETNLYAGRHLDQNLMCILYVTSRFFKMDLTFQEIMHHYRQQPQAHSRVYRQVFVTRSELGADSSDIGDMDSGGFIDLIKYYNNVFIGRVEEVVNRMDAKDGSVELLPIPCLPSHMVTPYKKVLNERVTLSPISQSTAAIKTFTYNINKSPVKELKQINRALYRSGSAVPTYGRPSPQVIYRY